MARSKQTGEAAPGSSGKGGKERIRERGGGERKEGRKREWDDEREGGRREKGRQASRQPPGRPL